jgi:hypothetical protein
MKDIDRIPGVDYQKQQRLIAMADRGDITRAQCDLLIRQQWSKCPCGSASLPAGAIDGVFYCWECYKRVFHQRKARGQ